MEKFLLLNKSVFFPEEGILAIGDLHLGYEKMLKTSGFEFPINQIKETKQELEKIFLEIKKQKFKLKKIVILGDLKHHFNFEVEEKFEIRKLLSFLEESVSRENIIILKGNHEKINFREAEYKDYFVEKTVAFTHGDKLFPKILDKKIKTIVMGHLHPAVLIHDPKSHKKEKYKCFLVGKWKGKTAIVLPSFLQIIEGTDIRSESARHKDNNFLIIPRKNLLKFKVFIPDKTGKVFEFPKLERIN
ncbi:Calcineurin-like phosphoesterase [uncultured archaeon]|nr:Calcineurin-like phosphoesterase [uncultured archaeon]